MPSLTCLAACLSGLLFSSQVWRETEKIQVFVGICFVALAMFYSAMGILDAQVGLHVCGCVRQCVRVFVCQGCRSCEARVWVFARFLARRTMLAAGVTRLSFFCWVRARMCVCVCLCVCVLSRSRAQGRPLVIAVAFVVGAWAVSVPAAYLFAFTADLGLPGYVDGTRAHTAHRTTRTVRLLARLLSLSVALVLQSLLCRDVLFGDSLPSLAIRRDTASVLCCLPLPCPALLCSAM